MNIDNQMMLHIAAGQLPPDDLLKHILAKQPNAFGFAVQNVFEGKPDLAITREDGTGLNFDELQRLFVNAKEFPLTMYFGKLADGYNPDDIQPFVINDGNEQPFMALFLEGTLNGNDDSADRTEQYNLVNGLLIPQITEWCEEYGEHEDMLERVMNKLRAESFKKVLMSQVGHRALLHVLPVEGDAVTVGKNDLGITGEWGWASHAFGFNQKAPEVVVEKREAAPVAKANRFGFGKKAAASVPASPPPVPKDVATPGTAERKLSGDKSNAVGSRPAQPAKAVELAAKPPSWVHTNDDVKLWYKVIGGEVHSQWKKRLPIIVKDFEAVKITNLPDFKKYALSKKLATTGTTETAVPAAPAETAKADAKALATVGDLPILNDKTLKEVLDYVATLDTSSKEIAAPKTIQEMEKALPNFASAVGLDYMETINWMPHELATIGKKDVMALVCYAIMWRSKYRALKSGQPEVSVKETEKSTTTTTTTGTATKVESVTKTQPAPAAKQNRFGFGKKAA
jgi:hypothetical protein